MAKRKRLTPPDPGSDPGRGTGPDASAAAPETKALFPMGVARHVPSDAPVRGAQAAPPIARVAGEAAALAAFHDLAGEVAGLRAAGRMIQALPLDAVDAGYLVRDRMPADDEDLASLIRSLRARGQQTAIEVVALEGGRYGLISGWRRLTALRQLHAEAPDDSRFATVQAILRRPETASDAYLAMVEENEIRVGLSYYERARIVARAAELGVFADTGAALAQLFASASRAKRSKIGSFLRLYSALDDHLRFAAAIPERLGLALVKRLDADPGFARRLGDRLRKTPPDSAAAEIAALERALERAGPGAAASGAAPPAPAQAPAAPRKGAARDAEEEPGNADVAPGIRMQTARGRVILSGPGVTGLLQSRLIAWLRSASDA